MGGSLFRSSPSTRSSGYTVGAGSPAVTPAGAFGSRSTPAAFGNLSFGSASAGGSAGGSTVGSTSPLPATSATTTTAATATPIPDRKKASSVQGYRSPGFGNAPVGGYALSGQARTPVTSSYRRSAYMSTPSQPPLPSSGISHAGISYSGTSQQPTMTPKTGGTNPFIRTAADRHSPLPFSRSSQIPSSTTTTPGTHSTDADSSLPLSAQDVISYESQLRSQAAVIEATRSKVLASALRFISFCVSISFYRFMLTSASGGLHLVCI